MIWIILLGGMVQGAFAQNLEIKGMVRDARNKEILEFANVVLQTMDSSFVAGTTTDMKGHFLLNKIKKGSYILSVSSLGFKTEYISLEGLSKNISLGEISLGNYILLCTISKTIKGHMIMYPFIIQSFFSFFFPFPSFLTLQERVFRKRGSRGSVFGL